MDCGHPVEMAMESVWPLLKDVSLPRLQSREDVTGPRGDECALPLEAGRPTLACGGMAEPVPSSCGLAFGSPSGIAQQCERNCRIALRTTSRGTAALRAVPTA